MGMPNFPHHFHVLDSVLYFTRRNMDMSAVINDRIVTSSIKDLYIPSYDLGSLLKQTFGKFTDRIAIVSMNIGCLPLGTLYKWTATGDS